VCLDPPIVHPNYTCKSTENITLFFLSLYHSPSESAERPVAHDNSREHYGKRALKKKRQIYNGIANSFSLILSDIRIMCSIIEKITVLINIAHKKKLNFLLFISKTLNNLFKGRCMNDDIRLLEFKCMM